MAKKRSIHELIEEQEPEAKQRMWDEVRQRIAQEDILGEGTPTCKKFSWKKIATIAASFVLVLGISLFSVFYFMPQEKLKSRYCTQEEYSSQPIEETIKKHAEINQKNWLYLDWYEFAESIINVTYYLNSTGEEICFSEEIISGETGDRVKIFITDNFTNIDMLENFIITCLSKQTVKNVEINYANSLTSAFAFFEYEEYRYYLELSQPMTETAILDIVEELLP
ncbi:hypothetical protein ESZ91_05135 [Candidatus Borkfalkia ceftriaxoniphila]|jgi:hypothetical protein|uniref:DUF4367 domain-containing protein n=1 Tax=Candidatus Borkfalkia ceftriaxoniphila TaxID=2508949 RepID=A0A4Q2KB35_9FIRM|nr:hypothetical protein [Candidatus Borkfalkia ceftriaxoniphila]RXZ61775.1 hypothetical protein ESZ91_05135 [Candidatus Borkfalkia ceftriaxoniphila]